MLAVVGLHGCFEVSEVVVHLLVDGHVDLGAGSPEHYDAVAAFLGLEGADVLAQGFNHLPTCKAGLYVVAVEALGVVLVEGGLHWHDLLEFIAHGLDVFLFQNFGVHGSLVGVGGIYVPAAEHDIVELGDGDDFVVLQILLVGAATYANLVVLGHRTDGFGQTFAGHENTCHKGCGNSTVADNENAQLTFSGLHICLIHLIFICVKLFCGCKVTH